VKISAKGRYGLQLMMELAGQYGRGPVQVANIAERQGLPPKYLAVLLGALKTAGLLVVQRGPAGGCELARHPSRITALEIFEALEGPIDPGPRERESGRTPNAGEQAVGALWAQLGQAMRGVLDGCTLADLAASQLAHEGNNEGYGI
jgi:Rrf2 family transcriptional regulator, cysteine metabolism repressor